MSARFSALVLIVAAGGLVHCSSETPLTEDDNTGEVEIALTNGPTDVACLRLTVAGTSRSDVRLFPLTSGQRALFRLNGLPVGDASLSADAFPVSCRPSLSGVTPAWSSDPVAARLNARETTHVSLGMIRTVGSSSPKLGAKTSALMD